MPTKDTRKPGKTTKKRVNAATGTKRRNPRVKKQAPVQEKVTPNLNVVTNRVIHDQIREKAFQLYRERGAVHGNDWSDWFEAEKIVWPR